MSVCFRLKAGVFCVANESQAVLKSVEIIYRLRSVYDPGDETRRVLRRQVRRIG